MSDLIFAKSHAGCQANAQMPVEMEFSLDIPPELLRCTKPKLPEVSELQTVRHYTNLSQKNFSIATKFYPLGSCTMKYNPLGVHKATSQEGFLGRHPLAPLSHSQGYLNCAYELQQYLAEITGMQEVALSPMAGAQGEFAGMAMIKAYHESRGDSARSEVIVPDAAHGTNPASAVMCGYKIIEIKTGPCGDIDLDSLQEKLSEKTAAIMLTNPSTLGVFERKIEQVASMVHGAGGLLYYDGANLNAILGKVRPGDMGFDVMHLNLHKTFATPHGGGGPGSGPVAVGKRLVPFLPVPRVGKSATGYHWLTEKECPQTIGRLSAFMGNAGIILRAYAYIRVLGKTGLTRVSEFATLNANYVMTKLSEAGYTMAYPDRRATHEFIVTLKKEAKELEVTAMDVAKRLLDFDCHAPTTYFPLLVPECLLIEPTETEDKYTLDKFIDAMAIIIQEAKDKPQMLRDAPHTMPIKRLDDVKAARELDLVWDDAENS